MPRIHPTAIVDDSAQIGNGARIGPHCIVEADVVIGSGCRLRNNVVVRRFTTMGANNVVDAFCVLGGEPQDFKFDPATETYLLIGDHNVFREGVTISRATGAGQTTRIGSRTYWMANSHAGHNVTVGDEVIMVNGACAGGHASLGDRTILSANAVVHQFCRVGRMVMGQGNSGTSMHVPPYTIFTYPNWVAGLNGVGLRRASDISDEDRRQIKEAFRITYRSGLTPAEALDRMEACTDWGKPADEFRKFVRDALYAEPPFNRGLCPLRAGRKPR